MSEQLSEITASPRSAALNSAAPAAELVGDWAENLRFAAEAKQAAQTASLAAAYNAAAHSRYNEQKTAENAAVKERSPKLKNAPPPPPKRQHCFLPFFAAAGAGSILTLAAAALLSFFGLPLLAPIPAPPPVITVEVQKQDGNSRAQNSQITALLTRKTEDLRQELQQQTEQAQQNMQIMLENALQKLTAGRQQSEQESQSADITENIAKLAANIAEFNSSRAEETQKLQALQAEKMRYWAEMRQSLQDMRRSSGSSEKNIALLQQTAEETGHRNQKILATANALRGEITLLQEKQRQEQTQITRFMALQNLQAAFSRNIPYKAELTLFNAAFPQALERIVISAPIRAANGTVKQSPAGRTNLGAALAQYRETGLPDKTALSHDFSLAADALADKWEMRERQLKGDSESGYWQKIRAALAPWIIIRPQRQASGSAAAAVLTRIEQALPQGDYRFALAEAEKLPPAFQADIQKWTNIMRLQLAADSFFQQTAELLFAAEPAFAANTSPAAH